MDYKYIFKDKLLHYAYNQVVEDNLKERQKVKDLFKSGTWENLNIIIKEKMIKELGLAHYISNNNL